MQYFEKFTSNTLAAGGNQAIFRPADSTAERLGRVYYRVFAGDTFRCSLLFSDTVNSTFADGSLSRADDVCGDWELTRLTLGVADGLGEPNGAQTLTVEGAATHAVTVGIRMRRAVACGRRGWLR